MLFLRLVMLSAVTITQLAFIMHVDVALMLHNHWQLDSLHATCEGLCSYGLSLVTSGLVVLPFLWPECHLRLISVSAFSKSIVNALCMLHNEVFKSSPTMA